MLTVDSSVLKLNKKHQSGYGFGHHLPNTLLQPPVVVRHAQCTQSLKQPNTTVVYSCSTARYKRLT